jgi:hypothetical protein
MPLPSSSIVLLSLLVADPTPRLPVSGDLSGSESDPIALAEDGADTTAKEPTPSAEPPSSGEVPSAPAPSPRETSGEEATESDSEEAKKKQKATPSEPEAPESEPPRAAEPAPPGSAADTSTIGGFSVGLGAAESPETKKDEVVEDKGVSVAAPDEQGTRVVGVFVTGAAQVDVGSGTFVIDEASRNEYVAWNGVLIPGYQFRDRTRLSLVASLTQELTQSDTESTAHQLQLSDLRIGVSRPIYVFEKTETQLFGELYGYAPTSRASRFDGLYTALDARLSIQQPVGNFFFSYRTAFRKNFHRYVTPVLSEEDAVDQNNLRTEIAREGGNEIVNAGIAIGGQNNVSFTWSNQLLAAYSFNDKLSVSALYVLAHGWTYESFPRDELTSQNAVAGRGRRDSSATDLSVSYQLLENLGLSGGIHTVSTPRGSDTRSLRFPFYEFSGAELNYSTFYVSATLTEKIPL